MNENEVAATKFAPISQLKELDQSELTPWLQKILKTDLLAEWIDEFKNLTSSSSVMDTDPERIHLTKYSSQPIIKL